LGKHFECCPSTTSAAHEETENISTYLTPKRELLHQKMQSKAIAKKIGILQNGTSLKKKKKPVKVGKNNYILSNTCAFDSFMQLVSTASCDSEIYYEFMKRKTIDKRNELWLLVSDLLKKVTVHCYTKRVRILLGMQQKVHTFENDLHCVLVEQSIKPLIMNLFKDYPSAT